MKKSYLFVLSALLVLSSCSVNSRNSSLVSTNQTSSIVTSFDSNSNSYKVQYNTDEHVSVYVYDGQDYSKEPILAQESYTKDSDGNETFVDGQVNILLVFEEGYELDSITAIEGTYKNIKNPSETLAYNVYRITKITSDTTITITSKTIDSTPRTSYVASFNVDDHAKVYVYNKQDYSVDPILATEALSRDSETGEETILGGQVNFKVVVDEGYEIRSVGATANTYSNIKLVDEENLIYRITKITADTEIKIKTKLIGDDSITTSYNNQEYSLLCDVDNGTYDYLDDCLTITCDDINETNIVLSGSYYGEVYVVGSSSSVAKIVFDDFDMISSFNNVFVIGDIDDASISNAEGTENNIKDIRENISDEYYRASIYSYCDLSIKGKGSLNIESKNGNGIHSKDDLKIKNSTLFINVCDNALKGNDSVTIESGNIKLISKLGDGIKTSNSSFKSDGVTNKGTITISGGNINIYSACDGIDSSYDVIIKNNPVINIYTDKYSEYSEEVTAVSSSKMYIRSSSNLYKYSLYFYDDENNGVWVSTSSYSYIGNRYYYEISKPSRYTNFKMYVYTNSQTQENEKTYYALASGTINEAYDTISYSASNNSFSWTNYQTQQMGGGRPGMGGMQDGNSDKKDYSTKGIKADNSITIEGGEITINSYDDGIHCNNDNTLESGVTPLGSISISGGTIVVKSNDDGVHADVTLTISGGSVNVVSAYEGLEGNKINISGGNIDVYATDDGINASGNNGSIVVSGGYVKILVPSGDTDAIDSNGTYTQTGGVVVSINMSSQGMATALDTDSSVSLKGGVILCFGNIERTPSLSGVASKSVSGSFAQGTYKLYDSENNLIAEFTLKTHYSKFYIAGESGEYKLVGSTTTTIKL